MTSVLLDKFLTIVNEEDYGMFPSTLTFVETNRQDCVVVPLLNDNSIEGTHAFSLEASHDDISTNRTTLIVIQDENGTMHSTPSILTESTVM